MAESTAIVLITVIEFKDQPKRAKAIGRLASITSALQKHQDAPLAFFFLNNANQFLTNIASTAKKFDSSKERQDPIPVQDSNRLNQIQWIHAYSSLKDFLTNKNRILRNPNYTQSIGDPDLVLCSHTHLLVVDNAYIGTPQTSSERQEARDKLFTSISGDIKDQVNFTLNADSVVMCRIYENSFVNRPDFPVAKSLGFSLPGKKATTPSGPSSQACPQPVFLSMTFSPYRLEETNLKEESELEKGKKLIHHFIIEFNAKARSYSKNVLFAVGHEACESSSESQLCSGKDVHYHAIFADLQTFEKWCVACKGGLNIIKKFCKMELRLFEQQPRHALTEIKFSNNAVYDVLCDPSISAFSNPFSHNPLGITNEWLSDGYLLPASSKEAKPEATTQTSVIPPSITPAPPLAAPSLPQPVVNSADAPNPEGYPWRVGQRYVSDLFEVLVDFQGRWESISISAQGSKVNTSKVPSMMLRGAIGQIVRTFTQCPHHKKEVPLDLFYFSIQKFLWLRKELLWYSDFCAQKAQDKKGNEDRRRTLIELMQGMGLLNLVSDENMKKFTGDCKPKSLDFKVPDLILALIPEPEMPVVVAGLTELCLFLVLGCFKERITMHLNALKHGNVEFDGLIFAFAPKMPVFGSSGNLGNSVLALKVVDCWFEEGRSLFGKVRTFKFRLSFHCAVSAEHFAKVEFVEELFEFQGSQAINMLPYLPLDYVQNDLNHVCSSLRARGEKYCKLAQKGAVYMEYSTNSFFPHMGGISGKYSGGSNKGNSSQQLLKSKGRLMLDTERGYSLGHTAAQGSDNASLAVQHAFSRYKNYIRQKAASSGMEINGSNESSSKDGLVAEQASGLRLSRKIDETELLFTWPAIVGFSFTLKRWGHVLVEGLSEISFDSAAFDMLVMPEDKKILLRAIVKSVIQPKNDVESNMNNMLKSSAKSKRSPKNQSKVDLVQGKGGGVTFLLHGPPGVGKTLTAESIAELLQCPLYIVSMGELGVSPDALESTLESILSLCSEWNALVLIDEADVFMEKRGKKEVLRNAMVTVLLRLVEYHKGILFLTSNRVSSFDPAFHSRVTLALKFQSLDTNARKKVWKNLLNHFTASEPSQEDSINDKPQKVVYKYKLNAQGKKVKVRVKKKTKAAVSQSPRFNIDELAKHPLNGRQIKNVIRLAMALAQELEHDTVSQEHLKRCIDITLDFQSDWQEKTDWDSDGE